MWVKGIFGCLLLFNLFWLISSSLASRWMIYFIPPQYLFAFLATISSLQFALRFPFVTSHRSLRVINSISFLSALIVVLCLGWFYYGWITIEARLSIALLIPSLIMLGLNLLIMVAYIFQINRLSRTFLQLPKISFWTTLIKPAGTIAVHARLFAIFYGFIILLNLSNVARTLGWIAELPYYLIFSNGMVVALTAFSLVFLSAVDEPVSFNGKLNLAVIMFALLIINMISPFVQTQRQTVFHESRARDVGVVAFHLQENVPLLTGEVPEKIAFIGERPAGTLAPAGEAEQIYPSSLSPWRAEPQVRPAGRFDMLIPLPPDAILPDRWYFSDDSGNLFSQDPFPITAYLVSIIDVDGRTFEIGHRYADYRAYLHVSAWPLVLAAVLAPIVVLLLFPMLFRGFLISPLQGLLDGVRRIKRGDLDTYVPVRYMDEIGFLTDAFNDMAGSIHQQTRQLREYNERLEEKVLQRTEELEIARQYAEKASAAKSAFLANMSHEVRTPLTAIIGYSEMLYEDMIHDGREFEAQDVRRIRQSGLLLLNIINDILDLSRIESGKLALNVEEVEVDFLLLNIKEMVEPLIEKNDNHFWVENNTPRCTLQTDRQRVTQCLLNLLGNAAKFTQKGQIRLVSDFLTEEDGSRWLRFSVQDNGIGIPEEELERIFEPFEQADLVSRLKFGGSGLGLAITRRFCEMLGGGIRAESDPGSGSTFSILLPLDLDGLSDPQPGLFERRT